MGWALSHQSLIEKIPCSQILWRHFLRSVCLVSDNSGLCVKLTQAQPPHTPLTKPTPRPWIFRQKGDCVAGITDVAHFLFSSPSLPLENYIIYLVCMCLCACHNIAWRSGGKLHSLAVSFHFVEPQKPNSGHWLWQQVPLSTEPSFSPLVWW